MEELNNPHEMTEAETKQEENTRQEDNTGQEAGRAQAAGNPYVQPGPEEAEESFAEQECGAGQNGSGNYRVYPQQNGSENCRANPHREDFVNYRTYPGQGVQGNTGSYVNQWGQTVYGQSGGYPCQPKKSLEHGDKTLFIVAVSVLTALVLFFGVVTAALLFKQEFGQAAKQADLPRERRQQSEDDFWGSGEQKNGTAEEKQEQRGTDEEQDREEYAWDAYGDYGISPNSDYYSGLTDSINPTTDYQVAWENEDFADAQNNTQIQFIYARLEGENIPNLEELNAEIKNYSTELMDYYEDDYLPYAISGDYFEAYATSYVTYNDDSTVSIVVQEEIYTQDLADSYLLCLNVDLVNGEILMNTDMLRVDDSFLREFRKQIAVQNGVNLQYPDETLYDYLRSESALILFRTPVGLEVGMNYQDDDGAATWITATLKDYAKYVRSA